MVEVYIDPRRTFKKLKDAGGADPANLELDPKKNGELLEACLDMLYYSSQGNLWNGGSISMMSSKDESFPRGSVISFIPVPLIEGRERVGVFTFSKDMENPVAIVSSIGVKCELTETGHVNLSGRFATNGNHSQSSMLKGVVTLAINVISSTIEK